MEVIEIMGSFGNEKKLIKIVQPHLSGNVYQVLIDNWYQGSIMKIRGEWLAYWNAKSDLGTDDIAIIGDIIDGHTS
jgi:hypothetical protein